jgi:hypothetical protein
MRDYWIEYQRRRWMKPNAAVWMRPDAARWLLPNQKIWMGPKNWEEKYRPDQLRESNGRFAYEGMPAAVQLAAADKPPLDPRKLAIWLAWHAIDAFRRDNFLFDLFGKKEGVVSYTTLGDKQVFGVNSGSDE